MERACTSPTKRNYMKRIISLGLAALTLLLSGCATVISSDVTAFNE